MPTVASVRPFFRVWNPALIEPPKMPSSDELRGRKASHGGHRGHGVAECVLQCQRRAVSAHTLFQYLPLRFFQLDAAGAVSGNAALQAYAFGNSRISYIRTKPN